MAAQSANKIKAYIRTTVRRLINGSFRNVITYTWLGCEFGNTADRTQDAVECSDKSNDWAQFIPAKRGGTFQVSCYADNTDAAQVDALKGLHNGSKVYLFIGELTDVSASVTEPYLPSQGELGYAYVTGISDTNEFGAVASRQISLTLDGELTHYPALPAEDEEEADPADEG